MRYTFGLVYKDWGGGKKVREKGSVQRKGGMEGGRVQRKGGMEGPKEGRENE